MSDVNKELMDKINELVTNKTLSMEAIEGLQQVRAALKKAQDQVVSLNTALLESRTECTDYKQRLQRTLDELNGYKERAEDVATRERKVFELEKRAAVAEATSNAYFTSLKTVFAPNIVREQIMKGGSTVSNGMTYPVSENGAVNRAEGYEHPNEHGLKTQL
jgi:ABC-type transporter Mla subunit MlaD